MLTDLLTYFRAVGLYNHCVHWTLSQCIGHAFTGPKAFGLRQSPLKLKNLSNKYKIRIFPKKRNALWSFSPTSELRTARRSSPSVVNSRPTTVAWRSHSASSFVHSTMTTAGVHVTQRVPRSVAHSVSYRLVQCRYSKHLFVSGSNTANITVC